MDCQNWIVRDRARFGRLQKIIQPFTNINWAFSVVSKIQSRQSELNWLDKTERSASRVSPSRPDKAKPRVEPCNADSSSRRQHRHPNRADSNCLFARISAASAAIYTDLRVVLKYNNGETDRQGHPEQGADNRRDTDTPIAALARVGAQARVPAAKIPENPNFAASVLIRRRLSYVSHIPTIHI